MYISKMLNRYHFYTAKEMEEQILRERCEILSQEIEKTQDNKWKTLVDKSYGINDLCVYTIQCLIYLH